MSSSTEYATIWVHWVKYYDSNEDFDNAKNFKKNMTVFDEHVNEYIEEGWLPHGSPQFSAGWFKGCTVSGSVVQAVVRETYYEEEEEEGEDDDEEEVVARCYVCSSYTTTLWLMCDHCGNIACNDCIFKESVPTGCARRDYCAKCVKFFSMLGDIHQSVVINPPIKKKHRCAAEKSSNRVCSVCDNIPCDRCYINNNTAGYCASCVKLGCDFYKDYQETIDNLLRK